MAIAKQFRKASRLKAKASIMLEGLSGRGKTGLALAISRALADDWDKIYYIDTENRSMSLYVGLTLHTGDKIPADTINVVDLDKTDGYKPSNYLALRQAAIDAGGSVVVKDSITHAWQRQGGVLDLVTQARNEGLDQYRAWGLPEVIKEKNEIFELIRDSNIHVITTVRVKEKHTLQYNEDKNKHEVVSLGEQQMQQEGLVYEPDLVLKMIESGRSNGKAPKVLVRKSRYAIFEVDQEYEMTPALLQQLRVYLDEGVDPEELLAKQREDYIQAIREYVDGNPTRKSILKELMKTHGISSPDTAELVSIKQLYTQLIGG